MRLKSLVIGLLLALAASSSAFAQCQGNPPAGRVCANGTAAPTLPSWYLMTIILDQNFGAPSTQGTILNRGASVWSATATPSLGLNGGTGGLLTLNGSSTGSAAIGVKAAAGSTTFNLPVGNGTSGFVLSTDGSGNTSWANPASGGTVTSVGLALPASILTVSGSPVTVTGTLTGTLATQSANLVWSGPTTGSAATPTFRSLVGADLPNPAASTLGGIESLAAVSHQWINTISTSGVPSATQPAFTDISGTATTGQLPAPSTYLDLIGSTQGDVLFRGASGWSVLGPGVNGQVLATAGAGGNPSWATVSGTGTVTNVATGSNVCGGPITTTGTIALCATATNTLLANLTGGSAPPTQATPTAVLDTFGTAQGDVLYRGSSTWGPLVPGSPRTFLQTGGSGANPSYTGFPYAAFASVAGAI